MAEALLASRRVPNKTESVSESVDKDNRRRSPVASFLCQPRIRKLPRKPRTYAQRNRERILEVAKEAFTRSGSNASLDDIAKEAGVGAGTLYRHFPTRDALIEAVYRTEVEKMAAAEKKVSESFLPSRLCEPGCCCSWITRNEADYRPSTQLGRWRAIEAV